MRWGRGFFRLWIVVTAIWVAAAAAFVGKEPFEFLWKPGKFEVTHEMGVTVLVDSSQSPEIIKAQMNDAGKRIAVL
jgi:hypothetical protein